MIFNKGEKCPECESILTEENNKIVCPKCGVWQLENGLVIFLVKVTQINDEIINSLSKYGEVDIVAKTISILSVTTDYENKNKIANLQNVIKVEVDRLGTFC